MSADADAGGVAVAWSLFVTVLAFNLLGETLRARWSGR